MKYPKAHNLNKLIEEINLYSQLKAEYGSKNINNILSDIEKTLKSSIQNIKNLENDIKLNSTEPNDLNEIKRLRPNGPRKIWGKFNSKEYKKRIEGALIGRMAGCTLGAPVEFWEIERMENLAKENNMTFPPTDYWTYVPNPYAKRYQMSSVESYTKNKLNGVPVDDDIVYTLLGLLILEDHGIEFTTDDVAKAWIKYLPYACTAEDIALQNLKNNISALKSGEINNPYCEWIGADIRSDPWGYVAPGFPEKAAELAYRDAYISHRRQGIYGEMYFSSVISAAFTVNDPIKALEIGLTEIPKDCALAKAVNWALDISSNIKNYKDARNAVDKYFEDMSPVHTINNACLTIFGITIGNTDFTKVIGETVAMGMDNDCTAATAGSIVGAIIGKNGIENKWYKNFNNKVLSYLIDKPYFKIDNLIDRFSKQAELII